MRTSAHLFEQNNKPTERFARFLRDIGIPGSDLNGIDAALQARFFQKKAGSNEPLERWELQAVETHCPEAKILEHLSDLGFLEQAMPTQQTYDRAAWPGALAVRAGARLFDLIAAWRSGVRWRETVVFTGVRPLEQSKEGWEEVLKAVRMTGRVVPPDTDWFQIAPTEEAMMYYMWCIADLPDELRALPVQFVSAPMKPNPKPNGPPIRPNSEDPVHLWLTVHQPAPGSMLFSSGAPYGMAQNEAMWMILGPLGHEIETFGHGSPCLPVENMMREVAGTVNRIRRARLG